MGCKLREEAGVVPPKFAIQWALYSWRSLANAPASGTPFYQAFAEKLGALRASAAATRQDLLARRRAGHRRVGPARLPRPGGLPGAPGDRSRTTDDGVWKLPDGEAYYAYLLRHYTTTDLTADEIHELGLAELARIHAEMRAIFDELGYPQDESLAALFDRVADDGGQVSGDAGGRDLREPSSSEADGKLDARL